MKGGGSKTMWFDLCAPHVTARHKFTDQAVFVI